MNSPGHRRRLNPFAFPAETNLRFGLLVAAALALAWIMGSFLSAQVIEALGLPEKGQWILDFFEFVVSSGQAGELAGLEGGSPTEAERIAALTEILSGAIPEVALIGVFFGLTFAATGWIYGRHPQRLRQRQKLAPATASENEVLRPELERLAGLAGVAALPGIEIERGSGRADGQAFGLRGRYILRLGGRMPLLLLKSPARFRAIVLHELAHIANQDIWRTYYSQALWTAVSLLALGGWLLFYYGMSAFNVLSGLAQGGIAGVNWVHLFTSVLPALFGATLRTGLVLLLVWMVRSSLLRARELYADWRADLWGAGETLQAMFAAGAPTEKPVTGWRKWLRLHPPTSERLEALRDPSALFRGSSGIAFLVGVLTGIGLSAVTELMPTIFVFLRATGTLLVTWLRQAMGQTPAALLLGPAEFVLARLIPDLGALLLVGAVTFLLAGTVGVQVQREAVYDAARHTPAGGYRRLWMYALMIVVGMEIGFFLTPLNYLAAHGAANLLLLPVTLVIWTAAMWSWLAFARFFTLRITAARLSTQAPQGWRRFLTLLLSLLAGWMFLAILLGRLALTRLGSGGDTDGLGGTAEALTAVLIVVGVASCATLGLLAVYFGSVWIYSELRKSRMKRACPTCRQPVRAETAVGRYCAQCGESLAPWLYI